VTRLQRTRAKADVDRFVEERCAFIPMRQWTPGASVRDLRDAYEEWCEERGIEPATRYVFNTRLYFEHGRWQSRVRGRAAWVGVILKDGSPVGDLLTHLLLRIRERSSSMGDPAAP
jgi:hypothetical protein